MEKYVITLEQAKRLHELGAYSKFAPSEEVWFEFFRKNGEVAVYFNYIPAVFDNLPMASYQAYSVGELGEILPDILKKGVDIYWFSLTKYENGWEVYYQDRCEISSGTLMEPIYAKTEAQARGALLIYLLENKLL